MGYHARVGTLSAILNLALLGEIFILCINGILVGEGSISAALAGHLGVPVALVTGDVKVIREMRGLLRNGFEGVEVKKGISRYLADCIPPEVMSGMIRDAARRAMSAEVKPYKVKSPCIIEVEFTTLEWGNMACCVPKVERVEPRKVKCTADNVVDAWKPIWASILLASGLGTRE